MTPRSLVDALQARGCVLTARDGKLAVSGPSGALTASLREALAAQKPAVIEILESYDGRAVAVAHGHILAGLSPEDAGHPEYERLVEMLLEAESRRSMPSARAVLGAIEVWAAGVSGTRDRRGEVRP